MITIIVTDSFHNFTMRSFELKTLEVAVVDFMALEEFVDEKGNIPQVVPDYNLRKDDILFSGTVDLMTNDKEYVTSHAKMFLT